MKRYLSIFTALLLLGASLGATEVPSYHYDQQSTGQDLTESTLTPAAVQQFRKRWSQPVDGNVYAQPLYMEAVNITTGQHAGAHDTVFIATEHDSLYAFDAEAGTLLWHTSLLTDGLPKATKITPVPSSDTKCTDIVAEIGITSTPVIDPVGGYLYVAAKSKQFIGSDVYNPRWVYTLFKVSISNGSVAAGKIIAATYKKAGQFQFRTEADPGAPQDPWVGGVADDNVYINGHYRVYFNALRQNNRSGTLLCNGNVYLAFGSHGDITPFHGWLLSFDAGDLGLNGVFCTTPNGSGAGIWQAGGIPAIDGSGNLFFMTGNGLFDSGTNSDGTIYGLDANGFPQSGDYGDCILKVAVDPATSATNQNTNGWGLDVPDYFSPMDNYNLSGNDTDLASGGLVILPDSVGSVAHPHLLIGAGKAGKAYLVDRDNMGKFNPSTENVVQTQAGLIRASFSTPAYFNGNLYWTGLGNYAQMFSIGNAAFSGTPSSVSGDIYGYPGATPVVTASGTNNGLVWMLDRDTNQLRVYDAQHLNTEYWTSAMAPKNRDRLGAVIKFTVPTVADGMAFVGTANAVYAYGGPPPPTAAPASPNQLSAYAMYGNEVELTWNNRATDQVGFTVEDSTNGVAFTEVATLAANATSTILSGLAPSSFYYFRIRAFNNYKGTSYSGYSNLAGAATIASTQYLDFSNGFAGSNSQLNYAGSASLASGSVAQLTDGGFYESGAIWSQRQQNVERFDTEFTFQILPDNQGFANGFAFVVQNNSSTVTGSNSGYLGFGGINHSIAIKVDAYPDLSTTGLYVDGTASNSGAKPAIPLAPYGLNFQSGDLFLMQLTYLDGVLTQTITDTVTNAVFTHAYDLSITGTLGSNNAYVGFTGATGGETTIQQIPAWTFATLPYNAPGAPADLTATPASATQINLAWKDPTGDAEGFIVNRRTTTSTWTTIAVLPPTTLAYNDTALTAGSRFSYTIHATNTIGFSAGSNIAAATTPTVPDAVSALEASSATASSVTLNWPAAAANADKFILTRQEAGSGRHAVIATLPVSTRTYTDNTVAPGVHYTYRIQASNLAGSSQSTSADVAVPTR